ncbi:Uncharacterized conserved protein, DUF58 family, contains vWF domain [Terribacillus aidingensis]|uniref:Uncharacterized conserved protein, DUF58 family, contains vWF domain n=1 Tax=Terribacillus aidingensis TaxID=586416 RepID=A0A285P250_9BACI|nr:DUF58 domain-containing protein [Terribacillus aidingensis]SNZ15805.1 Uncharacterized conserved protein, DUF58 family, contains vWF domain [Terribacillus aidingensis]
MKGKLRFAMKLGSLILLAGILFTYSMFQGGFVSWFLFYAYMPILLYVLILLFCPIGSWHIDRALSKTYVKSGGEVKVELSLQRRFPYPLAYVQVEDLFDKSLLKMTKTDGTMLPAQSRQVKQHILFPWFRKQLHVEYVLDKLPRGKHQLYRVRIRTGDPFQLIIKEAVFDLPQQLHVYPAPREITLGNPPSVFEEGAAAAFAPRSKQTNVVSGIREYTPGDRFSWIDWKASARKQDMMTKEFEQEKSADVLIALDQRAAAQSEDLFEHSIVIVYSVYQQLKRRNEQVGFLSIGKEVKWLPATMGSAQLQRVQQHLITVRYEQEPARIQALAAELSKQPKGSTVYYVTTQLDIGDFPILRALRQSGYLLVVLYICRQAEADSSLISGIRQLGHNIEIYPMQEPANRAEVLHNA